MGGNLKRLYYLGINVLSAIHGMSAVWDACYWEVSLYFLQMFPKDGLSKNITLEYDLSCIIEKDSISFSQKYDVFSRRKVKDDLSQKIHGNMMFSVHFVKNGISFSYEHEIILLSKKQRLSSPEKYT